MTSCPKKAKKERKKDGSGPGQPERNVSCAKTPLKGTRDGEEQYWWGGIICPPSTRDTTDRVAQGVCPSSPWRRQKERDGGRAWACPEAPKERKKERKMAGVLGVRRGGPFFSCPQEEERWRIPLRMVAGKTSISLGSVVRGARICTGAVKAPTMGANSPCARPLPRPTTDRQRHFGSNRAQFEPQPQNQRWGTLRQTGSLQCARNPPQDRHTSRDQPGVLFFNCDGSAQRRFAFILSCHTDPTSSPRTPPFLRGRSRGGREGGRQRKREGETEKVPGLRPDGPLVWYGSRMVFPWGFQFHADLTRQIRVSGHAQTAGGRVTSLLLKPRRRRRRSRRKRVPVLC